MPFDGLVLSAVMASITPQLLGGRIERVQQPDGRQIVLTIHNTGRQRLLISAHPEQARVHLTNQPTPAAPTQLPAFAGVLRKYLTGGRIVDITQPGFERSIYLSVSGRDELGRPGQTVLIGEFMGKHSNIVLVDPVSGKVLDGIRRYTHAVSRHRQILPGVPYVPPPRTKRNPLELDEDALTAELLALPLGTNIARALQSRLEGMSMVTASEIIYRAGLDSQSVVDDCGTYEFSRLWTVIHQVFSRDGDTLLSPCLVCGCNNTPQEFAALPLTHTVDDSRHLEEGDINRILDRYYTFHRERRLVDGQRQGLLETLTRELRRVEKRLDRCREVLTSQVKVDEMRRFGELLTANMHLIKHGVSSVTVNDYHTGLLIPIPLDPRLSPSANAQAYFRRFRKQKTAFARAQEESRTLTADRDYLLGVQTMIYQAESTEDLNEIREELLQEKILLAEAHHHKAKQHPAASSPRSFTASDGTRILVGKNNKQNDMLTFRVAQDNDLWLHARGVPGAHVVIRSMGRPVAEETITLAASLAAYYSQARQAPTVPVDYTLRRYVKKPRGARPGFVVYTEEHTVVTRPALLP